ncbi:craniofacial development protein 2-like [Ischnura elegans]|uniref:craniofacial development protein 2-like n=1 Tax=Ischnura elegans TaxID=197161 RepID=UPI001ED89619|nr:craniofacial development protein 2-like [Ischnura elegans]
MTFITAHAPTEDKTELEKEEFYECLDDVLNLCQKYDMVTVLGDFNAKIGREDKMKGEVGGYSIHEKSSENGDILVQFAARNNFIIKSTCFPHKRIHLGTWKVPGTNIVNQIDHVLTKKRHSSSVIDVRACRGPNCDSDHYLVRAIIKQKLAKTKVTPKSTRKHWNVGKLNIQENLEKYQRGMERKLFEYQADKNINEKWNDLETFIKEITEEEIGESRMYVWMPLETKTKLGKQ